MFVISHSSGVAAACAAAIVLSFTAFASANPVNLLDFNGLGHGSVIFYEDSGGTVDPGSVGMDGEVFKGSHGVPTTTRLSEKPGGAQARRACNAGRPHPSAFCGHHFSPTFLSSGIYGLLSTACMS